MDFKRSLAILIASAILTCTASCGKGKNSDSSAETTSAVSGDTISTEDTSAEDDTDDTSEEETETDSSSSATTEDTSDTSEGYTVKASTTESSTSASGTEKSGTTTSAKTTTVTTTKKTEPTTTKPADKKENKNNNSSQSGYKTCDELAYAYYQAYLDHDAEAVYAMFSEEEIDGYLKAVSAELGDEDLSGYFTKTEIIKAINKSMDNVSEIMKYYGDSDSDEWTFILEEAIDDIEEEDLNNFNKQLGTDFDSARDCQIMFYHDENNDKSFTGNSSSFLEKDGKWYLSISNAMRTDLINFMFE